MSDAKAVRLSVAHSSDELGGSSKVSKPLKSIGTMSGQSLGSALDYTVSSTTDVELDAETKADATPDELKPGGRTNTMFTANVLKRAKHDSKRRGDPAGIVESDAANAKALFDNFDRDGNGSISRDEVREHQRFHS